MENLHLDPTQNTPLINCDSKTNIITIEGESRPENVRAFYSSLFEWIDNYEKLIYYAVSLSSNEKKIELNFKLEYFNSSSLKIFMELIDKLQKTYKKEEQLKIESQITEVYKIAITYFEKCLEVGVPNNDKKEKFELLESLQRLYKNTGNSVKEEEYKKLKDDL